MEADLDMGFTDIMIRSWAKKIHEDKIQELREFIKTKERMILLFEKNINRHCVEEQYILEVNIISRLQGELKMLKEKLEILNKI